MCLISEFHRRSKLVSLTGTKSYELHFIWYLENLFVPRRYFGGLPIPRVRFGRHVEVRQQSKFILKFYASIRTINGGVD
jgi:hypothetical protein